MSTFVENLRSRPLSRLLFVIGMVLTLIGFLIPTINVKIPEDPTASIQDVPLWQSLGYSSEEEYYGATEEATEEPFSGVLDDTTEEANPFATMEEGTDATAEEPVMEESAAEEIPAEEAPVDAGASDERPSTIDITYDDDDAIEGAKNIFSAAKFFNDLKIKRLQEAAAKRVEEEGYSPTLDDFTTLHTSHVTTSLVIMFLASIAGIIVFFISKSKILDIVIWTIGAVFGFVATISIPGILGVTPIVGYCSVGGYLIFVGYTLALVGAIISLKHLHD